MNSILFHGFLPCRCLCAEVKPFYLGRLQCSVLVVMFAALFIVMPQSSLTVSAMETSGQSTSVFCNVSDANVCALQSKFLNVSGCCQHCSTCPEGMRVASSCNSTHDTQCEFFPCKDPNTRYRENHGGCVIECPRCTFECSPEENRCICDPDIEYLDPFCQNEAPPVAESTFPSVVPPSRSPSTLPSWGIGLIAVGAVLGIVAFSAGFLFMGVCTSKRRREIDTENSDNSSSVLVSNGRISAGTHSTLVPGYPNQSLIDLLRQTNSPNHSSLSSVKSSPKSIRSSPIPTRIEAFQPENYHLNTKSPVLFPLSNHSSPIPVRTIQVKVDNHSKSVVV